VTSVDKAIGVLVGERVPPSPTMTVPKLIAQQIVATPDSVAAVYEDTSLTYAEVCCAAGNLAMRMQERGTSQGDLVPMVMRNGPELIVAMLATMSLSAVFVPMDAGWPQARIDSLLGEIGSEVVLCSPEHPTQNPSWLSADLAGLADPASTLPEPEAGPDDLVYGLYTSGSTGVPKCALNLHRGLVNRFLYMTRRFSDRPDEVILQTSRHIFDASLWQLLWPLTTGARVIVPKRDDIFDLDAIAELIARHGVTITDFVPSVFNLLVDLMQATPALAGDLSSLHTILIGGEEINPRAVRTFRSLLPGVRIVNTYGPTEASIGSVFYEVTDADVDTIPIGWPIDNTAALILDDELRPVPPGEIGELYLGGDCVGAGYLGETARSEAVFATNPFPQVHGDRLYRTGDRAFLRPDGLIGYAGRRDHQVKIGGVRVEPIEIETALQSHPGVHEARVVVHGAEVKRLAAFVTGSLTVEELREYARCTLSQDLMPGRFTVLDRMPLTPTGKTDRAALVRAAEQPEPALPAVDGLTPTEGRLSEIWNDLLPGGPWQSSDNYFDVGGDSLGAQRLVITIRERLGLTIGVRDVVEYPTLADLAARLSADIGPPTARKVARPRLVGDIDLPADIGWNGQPGRSGVREILLTGATGFVGVQLLHDLVQRTDATVHCLVRAADRRAAYERLVAATRVYRLANQIDMERVVVIPGDLTAPLLGLPEDEYRALAERVDTVVHCGALVNMVLPYEALHATNVGGTTRILRLASTGTFKRVHFVSTLGLIGTPDEPAAFKFVAEEPVPETDVPSNGYSQSKWVAEQVLGLGSKRGIPIAIYRLGEVMPSSVTGVPNENAMSHLILRACLRLGLAFTSDIELDYTPVDYVGEFLARGVVNQVTGYYHVFQPRSVRFDELLARFRVEFGLREVSYLEFHEVLSRAAAADPDDRVLVAAITLLPAADEGGPAAERRLSELFRDATGLFDTTRATRLALDTGIRWTRVDSRVVRRYPIHVRSGEA